MFPVLLRSTLDSANDPTVTFASASPLGLRVGLLFWLLAIALGVVYFIYLFRSSAER